MERAYFSISGFHLHGGETLQKSIREHFHDFLLNHLGHAAVESLGYSTGDASQSIAVTSKVLPDAEGYRPM